jgi:hypothetical protein
MPLISTQRTLNTQRSTNAMLVLVAHMDYDSCA